MQVKKKSQIQEKRVAKEMGAKTVIASGALWGSKGDVRHDDFLVECKTTGKSFYTLSLKTWEKIKKEAIKDGLRIPLMCVDIKDGSDRYAIFEEKDFRMYKSFDELETGETWWTSSKSLRIQSPARILLISGDKESPVLVVTPWDDFLYMLKNGV